MCNSYLKREIVANRLDEWVKALIAKSDNLSLMPVAYTMESLLKQVVH